MVSGMFGKKPSHELTQHLEKNTGVLEQILQDFSATIIAKETRIPIRCFYELSETKKSGFVDFVSSQAHTSA